MNQYSNQNINNDSKSADIIFGALEEEIRYISNENGIKLLNNEIIRISEILINDPAFSDFINTSIIRCINMTKNKTPF